MIVAPVPTNEHQRLSDLRALHVLDTPSEPRFDRLVELACDVFEVPIAYLALVDADRQWFKARRGLQAPQTGRKESFCGHAILSEEVLLIPDARLDERFHDNPMVVGEPYIRFYAGHPLRGPAGCNVGTFCLADHTPRHLTARELDTFKKLAAVAQHELNLMDVIEAQRALLATQDRLIATQQRLNTELAEAAAYVRSLLPAPVSGPVAADWRFISSSQLGGDVFSYHWLDPEHLAIYLLDVSGHGIGSSLLSVTVHNLLRSSSIPDVRFHRPGQVLAALNRAFQMRNGSDKFFTMWYGVYNQPRRELCYGAAGHHPALLYTPKDQQPQLLATSDPPIGVVPDRAFDQQNISVSNASRLYLFSDGAFEVETADGAIMEQDQLVHFISAAQKQDQGRLDFILEQIRAHHCATRFQDDYSMLELSFGE